MPGPPPTSPATIFELPELVRNKIAAGEVIERPASVVKELVENALDAGAREIRVDLEEGGAKLVRVVDDGCGMGPADLELAFRPHATSKLREVEDLDHIGSLGFRGEALASIGSVARVRVVSRTADAVGGHEVENVGGRVTGPVEASAKRGTTIEVRDLFYNTPARRRFLKRTSTELGRCVDLLQRLSIAHVGVGFVVTHDGRRVHDVERDMDLLARIRRTFGADLAQELVPVDAADGTTRLEGFVAPPRFARRDTSRQMWFLNGRPLRDKLLSRALKEGYRGALMEGRQPVAFLTLSMDPLAVDVNVHPTKSEVRFRDERRMMGFVIASLREAVRRTDMATPGERLLGRVERRGEWSPAAATAATTGTTGTTGGSIQPTLPDPGGLDDELRVVEVPAAGPRGDAVSDSVWDAPDVLAGPFLRIARTYLVRSLDDGFEIVDQHALHERVTFERLLGELRDGGVEVQRLLVPELVELPRPEVGLLEEHATTLAAAGVEVAAFGPTTVAVHGLPARLGAPDCEELVRVLVETLQAKGDASPADVLEDVLHRRACRSSVMAGDALDDAEVRALLEAAARIAHDQTCPHGRPTRVRFTLADLEKAFHRK